MSIGPWVENHLSDCKAAKSDAHICICFLRRLGAPAPKPTPNPAYQRWVAEQTAKNKARHGF